MQVIYKVDLLVLEYRARPLLKACCKVPCRGPYQSLAFKRIMIFISGDTEFFELSCIDFVSIPLLEETRYA
jgi:hypothetical protein